MRIIIAHNRYQQRGGEDESCVAEAAMLRGAGHDVLEFDLDNDGIPKMNRLKLAARTIWNQDMHKAMAQCVRKFRGEVVHFHNTFPLMSPAAIYGARSAGAATVLTLHNYRLLCPNAIMLRDGKPCEDCTKTLTPWPAVKYKCYRNSRSATAVTSVMLTVHRALGTWKNEIDAYIAITRFAQEKFAQNGYPLQQLHVKPNFVNPDPGIGDGRGNFALFVGRMTIDKGIRTLLEAWKKIDAPYGLKIVGDGPAADEIRAAAESDNRIEFLGRRPAEETIDLMGQAKCLLFPSLWYETFGRVAAEAFSRGTPVIASNIGAMSELVDSGKTGLQFDVGDSSALAKAVQHIYALPEPLYQDMRRNSREAFEAAFSTGINLRLLEGIYHAAIVRRNGFVSPTHIAPADVIDRACAFSRPDLQMPQPTSATSPHDSRSAGTF